MAAAHAASGTRAEAEALRGLGLLKYRLAQYSAARDALGRALSLFESPPDPLGLARVRSQLGSVAFMTVTCQRQCWAAV